jgi:hypothetical protein
MRHLILVLSLAAGLHLGSAARAGFIFDTQSMASQTISSPLFGSDPVVITAMGSQQFSLDLATGVASVESFFQGTDLPDPLSPGSFLSYDLYNTPASTTGSVSINAAGNYDVVFTLLFELKITSGPLAGQTFETTQLATFAALDVPSLPFPDGTAFADPNPADTVVIYAKTSLPGVYNAGDPIGTSSGRTVTVLSVVPEPSGLATLGTGALGLLGCLCWRRGSTLVAAI